MAGSPIESQAQGAAILPGKRGRSPDKAAGQAQTELHILVQQFLGKFSVVVVVNHRRIFFH